MAWAMETKSPLPSPSHSRRNPRTTPAPPPPDAATSSTMSRGSRRELEGFGEQRRLAAGEVVVHQGRVDGGACGDAAEAGVGVPDLLEVAPRHSDDLAPRVRPAGPPPTARHLGLHLPSPAVLQLISDEI